MKNLKEINEDPIHKWMTTNFVWTKMLYAIKNPFKIDFVGTYTNFQLVVQQLLGLLEVKYAS